MTIERPRKATANGSNPRRSRRELLRIISCQRRLISMVARDRDRLASLVAGSVDRPKAAALRGTTA